MAAMQEGNETDRKHMSGADVAILFPVYLESSSLGRVTKHKC